MTTEGKTDMERVGLFQEMMYPSQTESFIYEWPFNEAAYKGKQMLPGGSKEKSALQVGYFDPVFIRIFEKEGYTDPIKLRRQFKMKQASGNIGKIFLPSNGDKKSGLGSYYGTIGEKVAICSREKNFITNPGKLGTGYGYTNITIGKDYGHAPDPYIVKSKKVEKFIGGPFQVSNYPQDYFDNNPYKLTKPLPPIKAKSAPGKAIETPFKPSSLPKRDGGMKAGTFDPYPSYFSSLSRKLKSAPETKAIFRPNPGTKSRPIQSILRTNVIRSINCTNYKMIHRVMAY
uniref:Cilia-and flagella-associated protein 96 n=1 Tax=Callorhinchus milii TaxID=7868 RepID=A0A4W3IZE1_CALMI